MTGGERAKSIAAGTGEALGTTVVVAGSGFTGGRNLLDAAYSGLVETDIFTAGKGVDFLQTVHSLNTAASVTDGWPLALRTAFYAAAGLGMFAIASAWATIGFRDSIRRVARGVTGRRTI